MGAFTNVQLSAAIASYVSCIFSPVAIFTTAVISRPSGTNRSLFPVDCASGGRGTGGGGGGGWLVGSLSLSVQVEISES